MHAPAALVSQSRSNSVAFPVDNTMDLRRMLHSGLSTALRLGVDAWFGEHLGLTASTAWQWCDVRVDDTTVSAAGACTKPLHSLLLGPTLRF